jgi:plastocyanin
MSEAALPARRQGCIIQSGITGYRAMRKLLPLIALAALPAFAADEAHTIVQKGRAFHPGEVTIARGESLTFTNADDFIHQIYSQGSSFSFDSDEKNPGENITETFTAAGTFEVHCHIHPKMKLVVHVR